MITHPDNNSRKEQLMNNRKKNNSKFNYQKEAQRTEAVIDEQIESRISNCARLTHGMIGIATESGELLDQLKKYIYYGNNLDKINIYEELGDVMWYIALICNELDFSIEDVMKTNIDKLKTRYPEKFSKEDSDNRDLPEEKKVLGY